MSPLVRVLVEHGQQAGNSAVKPTTDNRYPDSRNEGMAETQMSAKEHHREEDHEGGRSPDEEPDFQRLAQLS